MNLELILMSENDIAEFKKNVQCAFQKGFEDVFGKCEETILPEKDIDQSLNGKIGRASCRERVSSPV